MEENKEKNEEKKQIKISLKVAILIIIGIFAIIGGIIWLLYSNFNGREQTIEERVITEQGKNCITNIYMSPKKIPTCNDIKYDSLIMEPFGPGVIIGDKKIYLDSGLYLSKYREEFKKYMDGIALYNVLIKSKEEFNNYFKICFELFDKIDKYDEHLKEKLTIINTQDSGEISIKEFLEKFDDEYFKKHNLAINVGPYEFVSANIQNGKETINFSEIHETGTLYCPKYFNFISLNKDVENVNFDIYTYQEESIMDILENYYEIIAISICIILIIVALIIFCKTNKKVIKIFMVTTILVAMLLALFCFYISFTIITYDAKPIIYLYPEQETNVEVKLGNPEKITCSYPKYINEWDVLAKPNGDLIDLETNRNLYALYYESENIVEFKLENEGFCIKGEDSIKFLEEKLEILGLNEREAEEFIVYWLPKLESNNYNYIRFATEEEINKNMPLEINPKPDTIIRVLMTFKGLDKEISVEEQKLEKQERNGFVAVEWGGTEIK